MTPEDEPLGAPSIPIQDVPHQPSPSARLVVPPPSALGRRRVPEPVKSAATAVALVAIQTKQTVTGWAAEILVPGRDIEVLHGFLIGSAATPGAVLDHLQAHAGGLPLELLATDVPVRKAANVSETVVVLPASSAAVHPSRFEVRRLAEEALRAGISNLPRRRIAVDGSWGRHTRSGGWAYVSECGDSKFGAVTGVSTNLVSELKAILLALDAAHPSERLLIETDSRNALALLDGRPAPSRKVLEVLTEVREALRNRDVEFVWVKGHVGSGLHDGADRLAVQARRACESGLSPSACELVAAHIVEESLAAHRGRQPLRLMESVA